MSPKASSAAPADRVAAYDRLVAAVPTAERKGATMPYTSVNGNMYSYLDASGTMALRLSADDRAAFISELGSKLHEAYGIVQKEYVTVPAELLYETDRLRPWFERGLAYVSSLKAKPTTRSRAANAPRPG